MEAERAEGVVTETQGVLRRAGLCTKRCARHTASVLVGAVLVGSDGVPVRSMVVRLSWLMSVPPEPQQGFQGLTGSLAASLFFSLGCPLFLQSETGASLGPPAVWMLGPFVWVPSVKGGCVFLSRCRFAQDVPR